MDVHNVSELLKAKKIQPSSLRFGFLGLGIIASGIVKNLINSEHRVNLWCETPSKVSHCLFVDKYDCLPKHSTKCQVNSGPAHKNGPKRKSCGTANTCSHSPN